MRIDPRVTFLYTNIGRGHPFYLDGIIDALVRAGEIRLVRGETDVFEVSSFVPRLGWTLARWLYRRGASGRIVGRLYKWLRSGNNHNNFGLLVRIMGRDIRSKFTPDSDPLLVAHPTLVGILRDRDNLVYQHGEVVVPDEALISGASTVVVPTEQAARRFVDSGYEREAVFVSGLCIEPALVNQAEDCYKDRLNRIKAESPLVGAFYSSGAEPKLHLEKLTAAILSTVSHGGKAVVFCRAGGRFARSGLAALSAAGISHEIITARDLIPSDLPPALVVACETRREENRFTARLFPSFDYLVAPPHERSNWALGLGLPMFCVEPCFGPFAALNRDYLVEHGVAQLLANLEQAQGFGTLLHESRQDGRLAKQAISGWGRYKIDGFTRIARFLAERYGK